MNKLLFTILLIITIQTSFSQDNPCELAKNKSGKIFTVDKDDVLCLAKNSVKQKTLVYTFGIWCEPCIRHLPNAMKLAKEYALDFYILLKDKENSDREVMAINYLNEVQKINDFEIKVLNLKDKNGRPSKKYKKFLKAITPKRFENINDMSKYIILNKLGEVLMVTTWKDNREYDWEDDSNMIKETIIPILN